MELQQSACHPRFEVDTDGAHVSEELLWRLFEQEAQAAFAAAARRVEKVSGQARLPGARGAGDEDRASSVVPLAAEHLVETRDARRHAHEGRLMLKRQGGDAGHLGIRSIIAWLESDAFIRIRMGIGKPARKDEVVDYVLSPFAAQEAEAREMMIAQAVTWVETLLKAPGQPC